MQRVHPSCPLVAPSTLSLAKCFLIISSLMYSLFPNVSHLNKGHRTSTSHIPSNRTIPSNQVTHRCLRIAIWHLPSMSLIHMMLIILQLLEHLASVLNRTRLQLPYKRLFPRCIRSTLRNHYNRNCITRTPMNPPTLLTRMRWTSLMHMAVSWRTLISRLFLCQSQRHIEMCETVRRYRDLRLKVHRI